MTTLVTVGVFLTFHICFFYGMYIGRIAERTDQRRRREWQHRLDQQRKTK